MLYEAVLLFGVVFFAALAFGVVLQQRNGLVHQPTRRVDRARGRRVLPGSDPRRSDVADENLAAAARIVERPAADRWSRACAMRSPGWFLRRSRCNPLLGLSVPVTLAPRPRGSRPEPAQPSARWAAISARSTGARASSRFRALMR
jgi:hypothetical protein